MIDRSNIISSLKGQVGWRQPTLTGMPTLDASNLTTSSGYVFQDFNPFCTIQNLYDCQQDKDITESEFNTYLSKLQESVILKVANRIRDDQEIIENHLLFPYANNFDTLLTNDTKFVGYEIDTAKIKDISVIINQIILEFNAVDTVTVYLYSSNQKAALKSWDITTADGAVFENANYILKYIDSITAKNAGGRFFIGYCRNGLTAQAYNRDWNTANVQTQFNMLAIKAFEVDYDGSLWNLDDMDYSSDTYGLNFDLSVVKDYTSFIVQNKTLLYNAIGLQMAADVLEIIKASPRINEIQQDMYTKVDIELNGAYTEEGRPMTVGIYRRLNDEYNVILKTLFKKPKMIVG